MDKGSKIVFAVVIGAAVVSLAMAIVFFSQKETFYRQALETERTLRLEIEESSDKYEDVKVEKDRIKERLDTIYEELKEIDEEKKKLGRKNGVLLAENRSLSSRAERFVSEKEEFEERAEDLNGQIGILKRQLAKTQAELKKKPKVTELPPKGDGFMAGLLKEKISLEVRINRLKTKFAPKDEEIERLRKKVKILSGKIEDITEEKAAAVEEIGQKDEVANRLSAELLKTKEKNIAIAKALRGLEEEKAGLEEKIYQLQAAKSSLVQDLKFINNKLQNVTYEKDGLANKLANMNSIFKERLGELSQIKSVLENAVSQSMPDIKKERPAVQLSPIVVKADNTKRREVKAPIREERRESRISIRNKLSKKKEAKVLYESPKRTVAAAAKKKGRVVTLNKAHNFVVIDLGDKDGIRNGMHFKVERNGKTIGEVRVIEVRKEISAADIIEVAKRRNIKTEDRVVLIK